VSDDDLIDWFSVGIFAVAGQRSFQLSPPVESNRIEMDIHGTRLHSIDADLWLYGATSLEDVTPGDGNIMQLKVHRAVGSGPSLTGLAHNEYAHSSTPTAGPLGNGNRLDIVGGTNAFLRSNEGFDPPPPAEFFQSE